MILTSNNDLIKQMILGNFRK